MKTALTALAAALALGLGTAALAAPGDNTPAVTQWDISQESLTRQFSQGFGFAIDDAHPILVAGADSASVGSSADARARHRGDRQRERSHLHLTKAKHSH